MKVYGFEVWTNELVSKSVNTKQRITFDSVPNISYKTILIIELHIATRLYISVFARRLARAVRHSSIGVRSQLEANE